MKENEFSPEALAEARAIPEFPGGYEDITGCGAFAVDDPGIADPEDAISVESSGRFWRLGVHISLVSWFIDKGTALDREAQNRALSVYIPGKNTYMFPEELIRQKLSLSENRRSPVLSVFVDLDDDGNPMDLEIKVAQMRLSSRFTYRDLRGLFKNEPKIRALYSISVALSERRAMSGGGLIPIPYLKVYETNEGLTFERVDPKSPEQIMVTEPMILYNHILAGFLAKSRVPAAFRHQPEPHGRPPSPKNPLYPVKSLYALKRSHLSAKPLSHKGLGFSSYLQATSPLRRFTDLINQRQVLAVLENREPPYTLEELEALLPELEAKETETRRAQREAVRAAVLVHLDGKTTEGIISNKRKGGVVFLPDYIIQIPLGEEPEEIREGLRIAVKIRDGKAYIA
ncbi:MAG: ribonuclease catalytic domain-containing protein [candidate division WOR-3 bacterium]